MHPILLINIDITKINCIDGCSIKCTMHSAPITLTFTTSFISCVQAIYLSSFQSRRETHLYAFADITLQISP